MARDSDIFSVAFLRECFNRDETVPHRLRWKHRPLGLCRHVQQCGRRPPPCPPTPPSPAEIEAAADRQRRAQVAAKAAAKRTKNEPKRHPAALNPPPVVTPPTDTRH